MKIEDGHLVNRSKEEAMEQQSNQDTRARIVELGHLQQLLSHLVGHMLILALCLEMVGLGYELATKHGLSSKMSIIGLRVIYTFVLLSALAFIAARIVDRKRLGMQRTLGEG